MRNSSLAGIAAVALTGGSLLVTASPAQAADAVLYVRQMSSACSDTGSGTLAQPFCSIGPAAAKVTAGQTVDVGQGTYLERLTITSSGTPDQPITFLASEVAILSGATAGVTIDGQHDVVVQNLRVRDAADLPALDLRNSSAITIRGGSFAMVNTPVTEPAVRLTGVTRSTLQLSASAKALAAGVVMDATTSQVTLSRSNVLTSANYDLTDHSTGIQVEGPDNRIVSTYVSGFSGDGITVGPGATGTVVASSSVSAGAGVGIHVRGASGTAIANNTVGNRCLDGIRIDGASTGTSVQNNVLASNGRTGTTYCDPAVEPGVEIAVAGDATRDTVVDYNNVFHYVSPSDSAYSWGGTTMGLSAFRTASGQAAHDRDTPYVRDNVDSANSAAPGYQPTDRGGVAREDDPSVPNTGAGPVTYADRGSTETVGHPVAEFDVALDLGASSVTVDASGSTPGFVPLTSYTIDFGDGAVVTQSTPVATHRYAAPGDYTVTLKVSGSDGHWDDATGNISVLRRTGTYGLLALGNLRYAANSGSTLSAYQPGLDATAQLDIADAGDGQIALFSRDAGRYVTSFSDALRPGATAVGTSERFAMVRNADGTVSLKSVDSGRWVTSTGNGLDPLVASATTIGTYQKFYRVTVSDAGHSFKAGANNRFVTAESGGAKPLIANRTSVGPWEQFDLVDLGNGQIGLFAHANSRFVCADNGGNNPLIANRASVGAWERFTLIRNADGTVSLKAGANNRYVTAENAGALPLIANRTSIGAWEKFTLG